MSPYADLTLAGATMETKREVDPLMSRELLQARVTDYTAGQDASRPHQSHIRRAVRPAALDHQAGTHEVLLDDAIRLALQLPPPTSGSPSTSPWVPHVFQTCPDPDEAPRADRAGQLLSAHLAGARTASEAERTLSSQPTGRRFKSRPLQEVGQGLIAERPSGLPSPVPAHTRDSERKEFDMSNTLDWNAKTIAEFRANEGRVGGNFEGAPMVLLHHRGRKSGREYVNPMMYLPHDTEPDIIYVFATKGGAPTNPDWYHNLTAAGDGSVERGTETYKVTVRELTGAERDASTPSKRRYPGFAEYARQTAGVRTIPVLESGGRSPHAKTASEVLVTFEETHPPHRLVAHRRPADTPDSAPGSINHAGVRSMDRDLLLENICLTVKTAKAFDLLIVHSTINVAMGAAADRAEACGACWRTTRRDRTSTNAWEDGDRTRQPGTWRLSPAERDAADCRVIHVHLTEAGRTKLEAVFPQHLAALMEEFSVLSESELETLSDLCAG
jgi:deazaflavin-dependent oxidoreductase (nitroreductase family)